MLTYYVHYIYSNHLSIKTPPFIAINDLYSDFPLEHRYT